MSVGIKDFLMKWKDKWVRISNPSITDGCFPPRRKTAKDWSKRTLSLGMELGLISEPSLEKNWILESMRDIEVRIERRFATTGIDERLDLRFMVTLTLMERGSGSDEGWGEAGGGWNETDGDTMVEAKATQFHVEIRTDKLGVRNWWTRKRV